jgi:hypothetical protein
LKNGACLSEAQAIEVFLKILGIEIEGVNKWTWTTKTIQM